MMPRLVQRATTTPTEGKKYESGIEIINLTRRCWTNMTSSAESVGSMQADFRKAATWSSSTLMWRKCSQIRICQSSVARFSMNHPTSVRKDPSLAVRDRKTRQTTRWTQNLPLGQRPIIVQRGDSCDVSAQRLPFPSAVAPLPLQRYQRP